ILADTKLYDLWQVNSDAEYHEAGPATAEETTGPGLRLVPTRVVAAPELAPEGEARGFSTLMVILSPDRLRGQGLHINTSCLRASTNILHERTLHGSF